MHLQSIKRSQFVSHTRLWTMGGSWRTRALTKKTKSFLQHIVPSGLRLDSWRYIWKALGQLGKDQEQSQALVTR